MELVNMGIRRFRWIPAYYVNHKKIDALDKYTYLLRLEAENASRHKVTAFGDAQLFGDSYCVFSTTGYLTVPESSASFDFTGNDFTIATRIKTVNNTMVLAHSGSTSGAVNTNWVLSIESNKARISISNGSTYFVALSSTTTVNTGASFDIRVERSGNTYKLYVNGSLEASATDATAMNTATYKVTVGDNGPLSTPFNGYMDFLYIYKGIARAPIVGVDAYTVLALDFDGTAASTRIIDSAKPGFFPNDTLRVNFDGVDEATSATDAANNGSAPHTLLFQGNSKLDTADKKFGTASLEQITSTDNVQITDGLGDYDFTNSSSYTVECWVKWPTNNSDYRWIFSKGGSVAGWGTPDGFQYLFGVYQQKLTLQYNNGVGVTTVQAGSIDDFTQWTHVRWSFWKPTNTMRLFVNGIEKWSGTVSSIVSPTNADRVRIGNQPNDTAGWIGHIDDLRVRNTAENVASFDVPSRAYGDLDPEETQVIPDISGNENDATQETTPSRRPLYDPTNVWLDFQSSSSMEMSLQTILNLQRFTIVIVFKPDAEITSASNQCILGPDSSTDKGYIYFGDATSRLTGETVSMLNANATNTYGVGITQNIPSALTYMTFRLDGTTETIRKDGTTLSLQTSTAGGLDSDGGLYLKNIIQIGSNNGLAFFDGKLAAIFIFDEALSDTVLTAFETAVSDKYGI